MRSGFLHLKYKKVYFVLAMVIVSFFINISNAEADNLFFNDSTSYSDNYSKVPITLGLSSVTGGHAILASKQKKESNGGTDLETLKIADLNVANYNEHNYWYQRRKLMAKAIDDSGAMIVTFQEIGYDPTKKTNMAEQLLKELKKIDPKKFSDMTTMTNVTMRRDDRQSGSWEGLAIIYPKTNPYLQFITGGSFPLSVFGSKNCTSDSDMRIMQYAKFIYYGHLFYIFNVHLATYHSKCRHENAEEALRAMAEIAYDDPKVPRLMIGDFNTTDSCNKPPKYQCDYDPDLFNILRSAKLTDLWRHTHDMNQNPGYTWSFFVIKKADGLPFERSDYAWGDYALTSLVKSVDLFATKYKQILKGKLYPSDHYGIIVTLQFD